MAAETKYGLSDEIYNERITQLSVNLGKEAAKHSLKAFVEVSTAHVYESSKKPSDETSKLKPWTSQAKMKLKAEEALSEIKGLPLIILRPAIVYGEGDIYGITPRIIIAAVYKELQEEMKLLWTKDLKINTVHVSDVARAIWFVSASVEQKGGRKSPIEKTEVYNLCDRNDSDQGSMNEILESVFGIKTGFHGTVVSSFAKLNMNSVTEDINDKHMEVFSLSI